ncbi:phBC6A51 family helix-turn-helix protein [Paenibacillus mesotrionivorans]|uniref:PhBC6A51 family helix-turn-helix protein n=1 Tax=Paenibacillus mesotrionivorans TaxID=3160968 RepID=A0ACC7P0X5_9BACL
MARKKRRGNYPKRRLPLDERHYRAIDLLTTHPRKNHEEIAQELGITRMTLFRWRNRPDFDREYRRILSEKVRILTRGRSVDVLAYAMKGDAEIVEWAFVNAGLLSYSV